jgi:hypothetical protein
MRARRFEGDDAAARATILAELARHGRAARVVLQLRIVYETSRRGGNAHMCEVFPESERTIGVGDAAAVAELVETTYSMHYTYRGRVVGGRVAVFALDEPAPTGEMELRMRRLGLGTTLAVDADASWDTGTGRCVYDYLLHRYGAMRAVKRGGLEYLRALVEAEQSEAEQSEAEQKERVDTLAHGVTTREVCAVARALDVRVYAARVDGTVFHAQEGSARKPALAFAVANGHMFPVTDACEVSYMAQRGRLRERAPDLVASHVFVDEREALERVVRREKASLVVATSDLTELWLEATRATGLALNACPRVHGAMRLVRFATETATVAANVAWPDLERIAASLGVECHPVDGAGTVARRFFFARLPALRHTLLFQRCVDDSEPSVAFVGRLDELRAGERARSFDLRRCYATVLEANGGHAWAVDGMFDEVAAYDGKELGPGRYFLEAHKAAFLSRGAGWYHERWARRAVQFGAKVVMQQRSRRTFEPSFFAGAVAETRGALGAHAAKFVVNCFIGSMRTAERARGRCFVATYDEARCVAGTEGLVADAGDVAVAYSRHRQKHERGLCGLYDQVIEGGWVALDGLCARLLEADGAARVVAVKTDAVLAVTTLEGNALERALGDDAREEEATMPDSELATPADAQKPDARPLEWVACGEAPCMFVGMAGTGKTVEALAALERERARGMRVLAVGPTVQAARAVRGVTFHALFGITQPECFADPPKPRLVEALAARTDVVLVDEVFMCTEWMLAVLLALSRRGVRLVLAGDPEQLPPVRSGAPPPAWLVRSRLVHELVKGRAIRLCTARRSRPLTGAPSLFELCAALLAEPCSRAANARFVAHFEPMGDLPCRNLAYLNATCARINGELARRRARGRKWVAFDGASATVLRGAWDLKRAAKDTAVFPTGAPLVARSAEFFDRGSRVALRSVDETHAELVGERKNARVPLLDVALGFELAFCTTIHKAQCTTIDEPYAVHDVPYILRLDAATARALLYVACSRARGAQLVRIGP